MEKFIKKITHLKESEIKELLYYYQQGINIGKEETIVKIINNMINMSFDIKTIAQVTNQKISKIKQYIA